MDRRTFLGVACSAAASPLFTPVVFAAAPGENRLVVIVLRGGMDGVGVVQPYGNPDFAHLRPTIAGTPGAGLIDLDGFFGLSDHFEPLAPLWRDGDLAFVSAVSTPYRAKRSHFDGQDFLENGGDAPDGNLTPGRDGWLNRALSLIPGADAETAMAVGHEHMLLLHGRSEAASWSPQNALALADDERMLLSHLYRGDPLFAEALKEADMLSQADDGKRERENGASLAHFAADRLNGPARIAAFSLGGWDTHRNQVKAMRRPARQLNNALVALRDGLGRNWDRTLVVAVTEFGRTARENGSGGTDHGTGGMAVLAGGALAGGRIYGDRPRLGESDLFEGRDITPTDDLRRWAAWGLAGQFGLDRSSLERTVFPGLEMGRNPGIVG